MSIVSGCGKRPPWLAREQRSLTMVSAFAALLIFLVGAASVLGMNGEGAGEAPEINGLMPMSVLALEDNITKAIVVDVGANRLYELHRVDGVLDVARDYYVAIGKQGADKRFEGDEKTPIGVYTVTSHIPGRKLPAIYGVGALPMDYPSPWDLYMQRTGSGIWLHGTNKSDDELLPRSSRGCLTLRNEDFDKLMIGVDLGDTPVIVANAVDWQPRSVISAARDELLEQVESWRRDWESRDTEAYLSHYDSAFRSGSMGIDRWSAHKRRVNSAKRFIKVDLGEIGVYRYPGEDGLFVVRFRQTYRSNNFDGVSSKQQYWRKTELGWKILVEDS